MAKHCALLTTAEQKILPVGERRFTGRGDTAISDIVYNSMNRLDLRIEHRKSSRLTGIPSGFVALDRMTSGFQRSELIILASRPSMGKTACVCNMAEAISRSGAGHVLLFSLDQASIALADRLLASVARVHASDIRSGSVSDIDHFAVRKPAEEIAALPTTIEDKPSITLSELSSITRRLHRRSR